MIMIMTFINDDTINAFDMYENVFDMYDNHYNDDTVRMRSFRDMENWETMFFHRVTKCI